MRSPIAIQPNLELLSLVYGRLCGVVAAALASASLVSFASNYWRLPGKLGWHVPELPAKGVVRPENSTPRPSLGALSVPPPQLCESPETLNFFSGLSGAAGVLTMSLGSLLIVAHFYAALTATNAALLAVSLIAAGGRLPALLTTGPAWRHTVFRAALCLTPLLIAVASVWKQ